MLESLAALAGAILTVAACYAAGTLLVDFIGAQLYRQERFPLSFLLGAAVVHLAVFAVLVLRIAYWPVLVGLELAVIGQALWKGSWSRQGLPEKPLSRTLKILWSVTFGGFTLLYFFHAWAPESSPDGSGYHLSLVARYLRAHGFERITTNLFASLSGGLEMLFVPAFAVGRNSAAALVHLAFTIALALAMFAYGRRIGMPWAGAAAALLTYISPVVGIDGSSAYNDVAAAAVVFAAFYWLQLWDQARWDSSLLIPAGLLAGYAYAVKYPAGIMIPFALAFVAWYGRKWRLLVPLTAGALLMIAPWMIKNWIVVRNPVAPVANQIFRNPYMHVSAEQDISRDLRSYKVANKWTLPLEVTLRGEKTSGLIGPVFLAAPLALLALRRQLGRRLLAAGALLLATYLTNFGTRFLIPCLPFFSLAMVLPIADSPRLLTIVMLFHAIASWPASVALYSPNVWRLDRRVLYEQALRIIPQDAYLRQNYYPYYGAARLVEAAVPKGERVLAMSALADAYTSREILVSWSGALNQSLGDSLTIGWLDAFQPLVLQSFSFPEKTVRRIRVLQTGQGDYLEQWSVQELRFFDHGAELPKRPEWKLRAWPNPWDVQLAFDNSPATRWRTWETARPGMYLDVDFGQPRALDAVHIETSYDYLHIKVIVEAMDEAGSWVPLSRDPVVTALPPVRNIRRAATYELKAHGIHYLLIQDSDYGAQDFRDDPEGWGLTPVAAGYGITIYRVT